MRLGYITLIRGSSGPLEPDINRAVPDDSWAEWSESRARTDINPVDLLRPSRFECAACGNPVVAMVVGYPIGIEPVCAECADMLYRAGCAEAAW